MPKESKEHSTASYRNWILQDLERRIASVTNCLKMLGTIAKGSKIPTKMILKDTEFDVEKVITQSYGSETTNLKDFDFKLHNIHIEDFWEKLNSIIDTLEWVKQRLRNKQDGISEREKICPKCRGLFE